MSAELVYQQYWDGDPPEYLQVLRDEIAEAIEAAQREWALPADGIQMDGCPLSDPRELADAVVERVFDRVKLHTWCGLDGCVMGSRPDCRQTHYAFDIRTHPRKFVYPADHDR